MKGTRILYTISERKVKMKSLLILEVSEGKYQSAIQETVIDSQLETVEVELPYSRIVELIVERNSTESETKSDVLIKRKDELQIPMSQVNITPFGYCSTYVPEGDDATKYSKAYKTYDGAAKSLRNWEIANGQLVDAPNGATCLVQGVPATKRFETRHVGVYDLCDEEVVKLEENLTELIKIDGDFRYSGEVIW